MKRAWLIIYSFSALSALSAVKPVEATNAIVGEAAGCPYVVKLGVACAIRNRGTLKGVYGFNARHNQFEPAWVWADAARAWRESATHHIVLGATHFGSAGDVAKGTFTGLHLVCTLGTGRNTTYFFK